MTVSKLWMCVSRWQIMSSVASKDSSVACRCSSLIGSMDDVTSSHSNTGAWGKERGEGEG